MNRYRIYWILQIGGVDNVPPLLKFGGATMASGSVTVRRIIFFRCRAVFMHCRYPCFQKQAETLEVVVPTHAQTYSRRAYSRIVRHGA